MEVSNLFFCYGKSKRNSGGVGQLANVRLRDQSLRGFCVFVPLQKHYTLYPLAFGVIKICCVSSEPKFFYCIVNAKVSL